MTETLSDKIEYEYSDGSYPEDSSISTQNIKQFIKDLKDELIVQMPHKLVLRDRINMQIDKLAGEDLR